MAVTSGGSRRLVGNFKYSSGRGTRLRAANPKLREKTQTRISLTEVKKGVHEERREEC